jgi:hypothetical protein
MKRSLIKYVYDIASGTATMQLFVSSSGANHGACAELVMSLRLKYASFHTSYK